MLRCVVEKCSHDKHQIQAEEPAQTLLIRIYGKFLPRFGIAKALVRNLGNPLVSQYGPVAFATDYVITLVSKIVYVSTIREVQHEVCVTKSNIGSILCNR